jgi:hypothetical protein
MAERLIVEHPCGVSSAPLEETGRRPRGVDGVKGVHDVTRAQPAQRHVQRACPSRGETRVVE